MREFIIFTDSGSDLSPETLSSWNVRSESLTFRFTDSEEEFLDGKVDIKKFYDAMRAGRVAKTAAVNTSTFEDAFEKAILEGYDILYIGFSSGLSTTFNSGRLAAASLTKKYPDSKLIAIDSLAASAGLGLLVKLAVDKKASGATIEETAKYIESIKLNLCHWFTVDDLVYLKRGGRISATSAFVGNLIGIKPVLHVDNDGHLTNVAKVRGRKVSVGALADNLGKTIDTSISNLVYISHADCMSDVEYLAEVLKTKYGAEVAHVTNVGSVIGAHAGPGTLALFFLGKER